MFCRSSCFLTMNFPLMGTFSNGKGWSLNYIETAPPLPPPHPGPLFSSHPSYPFTQNDGHFSVILHEENYATKPCSNMAAVGGRSLVGRLALVTGKLLFCDANKVSLRINKWRERFLRSPSSFFLHRGNF